MVTGTGPGGGVGGAPAGAAGAADSLGTDFWLAFPGNYFGEAELTLFVTGPTATTGTVSSLGTSQNFTVTPGAVTSVALDPSLNIATSDTVEDLGIHVTANAEVTVYGLNRIQYTTDAFLGLPTDILGTEYVVQGYGTAGIAGSEFAVVASTDNTSVTITPSVTAGDHPAGTPYTVDLAQGQTYQLRSADDSDLSGTIVTSDEPVGVFGGHSCTVIPDAAYGACDHLVEEMTPTATWGKAFVTEPLATRTGGDTFRFLADTAGTTVKVNGSTVATLGRGELFQTLLTSASVVTSDKPILVTQYSNSTSFDDVTSDPFEVLVPPAEQFLNSYTVSTPASGFDINYVNVVVPTTAAGTVKLDNVTVPAGSFTSIPGSGYSGAQIAVTPGTHNLTGAQPFGVTVYGFADYDSYGYPGGLSLAPVATVTTVALAPPTGSNAVNTEHCVTATVEDQSNTPVVGVRVDFSVTGVNPTSGFSNTAADGTAQFCYTGTVAGSDTITAAVGTVSDTATQQWTQGASPTLSVTKTGTGSGSVTSNPGGISCGGSCSASFTSGTSVTLSATPASGSVFSGWSGGGCSGTGACVVALTANTDVEAAFTAQGAGAITVTATASPETVTAGGTGKVRITVGNSGATAVNGVVVTVAVPSGATPQSITPTAGSCTGFTAGTATCSFGTVAAAGTA